MIVQPVRSDQVILHVIRELLIDQTVRKMQMVDALSLLLLEFQIILYDKMVRSLRVAVHPDLIPIYRASRNRLVDE